MGRDYITIGFDLFIRSKKLVIAFRRVSDDSKNRRSQIG